MRKSLLKQASMVGTSILLLMTARSSILACGPPPSPSPKDRSGYTATVTPTTGEPTAWHPFFTGVGSRDRSGYTATVTPTTGEPTAWHLFANFASVPVLSRWGVLVLCILFVITTGVLLRRRRRVLRGN